MKKRQERNKDHKLNVKNKTCKACTSAIFLGTLLTSILTCVSLTVLNNFQGVNIHTAGLHSTLIVSQDRLL